MGLLSHELGLDLKPSYVIDTINGFLKDVSMIGDVTERLRKVDEFVTRLEDEMKKIEVFKRELPLCMLLLNDAIRFLNQELAYYSARNAHQPILEEFIPLKKEKGGLICQISDNNNIKNNDGKEDVEDCSRDKKNWMSSVQLWSGDNNPATTSLNSNQNQTLVSESHKDDDKRNILVSEKKGGSNRGVVPMIHSFPSFPEFKRSEDVNVNMPRLSLLVPGIEHPGQDTISSVLDPRFGINKVGTSVSNGLSSVRPGHQQANARKQRRCWSPELHRRFVDALTQLGGPQVATPKQIRELMRVDGLTNDEVKSHLQKYRLHSRRVPKVSAVSENENGNGSTGSSKPMSSQSGSPEGPLHLPALTGGTSTTGGDSMEDEDDEKSESYSWKGHSYRPVKDNVYDV